jgi:hypothetical protein
MYIFFVQEKLKMSVQKNKFFILKSFVFTIELDSFKNIKSN